VFRKKTAVKKQEEKKKKRLVIAAISSGLMVLTERSRTKAKGGGWSKRGKRGPEDSFSRSTHATHRAGQKGTPEREKKRYDWGSTAASALPGLLRCSGGHEEGMGVDGVGGGKIAKRSRKREKWGA